MTRSAAGEGRPRRRRGSTSYCGEDVLAGSSGSKTGGQRLRARARARRFASAQRLAVGRGDAARTGSAWWRISPPTGTSTGWSSSIRLTTFSPGMSSAVTTTTVDQSNVVVELDRRAGGHAARSSGSWRRTRRRGRRDRRRTWPRPVSLSGPSRRSGSAPRRDPARWPARDDDQGPLGAARSGVAGAGRHRALWSLRGGTIRCTLPARTARCRGAGCAMPAAQSRPRRSARPGVAPVCTPPSTTSSPLTIDVLDAVGELARLVVGRVGADRRRVEDDEVGDEPIARCGRGPSGRGGPPAAPVILRDRRPRASGAPRRARTGRGCAGSEP